MDTKAAADFFNIVTRKMMYGNSFVGIDIGTSTTKVVQLGIRNHEVILETYGEISNAPYADAEIGKTARPNQTRLAEELGDIMHEIDARSRRSGVAIPFNETLMNTVELPKRDKEQMDKIIPSEARRFIPVPIEEIMLDWYVIPDEQTNAFDTVKAKQLIEAQFQKVMVVGVNKKTAKTFTDAMTFSGFSCEFFEIEIFGAMRASLHTKKEPTLILDMGASSTKAAIVNEHWVLLSARLIPVGGALITADIEKANGMEFAAAERLKCEKGILADSSVTKVIEASLSPLWTYINQIVEEHAKQNHKAIKHVLLCGGGAYMPGIVEHMKTKLPYSVEVLNGFQKTKGPMILSEAIELDGPRYAIAAGLALRGLGK